MPRPLGPPATPRVSARSGGPRGDGGWGLGFGEASGGGVNARGEERNRVDKMRVCRDRERIGGVWVRVRVRVRAFCKKFHIAIEPYGKLFGFRTKF